MTILVFFSWWIFVIDTPSNKKKLTTQARVLWRWNFTKINTTFQEAENLRSSLLKESCHYPWLISLLCKQQGRSKYYLLISQQWNSRACIFFPGELQISRPTLSAIFYSVSLKNQYFWFNKYKIFLLPNSSTHFHFPLSYFY